MAGLLDLPTVLPPMVAALGLAAWVGHRRPRSAARIGGAAAAATATAFAALSTQGSVGGVDLPWLPASGSRLTLGLDALSAPIAVFVSGLAAVVLGYTDAYLPRHLAERGRSIEEQARFSTLMLGFMVAMLLLALAQDLLVIFVALESTALLSFFLIEFDREDPKARRAARTALIVTAGTALFFLIGLASISASHGTTVLASLEASGQGVSPLAAACLVVGLLAKSAQMPLHFWLPRAMVAPTPVSAYLHSAALVAAGVLVMIRLRPLFDDHATILISLEWIGFATLLVGGWLALTADAFKRILAYSTMAQYGHVLVMIGAGGDEALVGAPLFLVAHGLCKAGLFLSAGAVTTLTGADRLSHVRSRVSGGGRAMPVLATASALAALGLAGAPATMGYFKEELFFAAAAHAGPPAMLAAVVGAALTVAYVGRFWLGLFGSRAAPASGNEEYAATPERDGASGDRALGGPVAVLAAMLVVSGLAPGFLERVFAAAGAISADSPVSAQIAYHLEPRAELGMTIVAWSAGLALVVLRRRPFMALLDSLAPAAARIGPAAAAEAAARLVAKASNRLHELEVRDLRARLATVLLPGAALVAVGVLATGRVIAPPGPLRWVDAPLAAALLTTAVAGFAVARARGHMAMVLLLSFVGFGLALVFSIADAPEVALVVVIVETLFTLLFVSLLARIPARRLAEMRRSEQQRRHGAGTAVVAGTAAFFVAWFALGEPRSEVTPLAYADHTERAHAQDTVSAIVSDFRGLDTLGEITVLVVALVGAIAISRERSE